VSNESDFGSYLENIHLKHGRPQKFSRGGNVDTLLILFRLLTMQCKRTLTQRFTLSTPLRNCTMLRQQSQKYAIFWQQCFCSFMLLSTQYKTTWLPAISSHCLAVLPVKNICVQQMHAAKRLLCNLKSILEDLLSSYFSTIKTNERTIRPKFHNLPLQTIERILVNCKTSSLHETRTVNPVVVQHECHTSVETACGEPV